METLKEIAIGIEDFKTLIEENCYYIDKTLMIRDIIDNKSNVKLITRPRRFGKTLNMSMLQYFFESTETDYSYLFRGLDIMSADEKYLSHMGKYPVISLTLKGIEYPNFDYAYSAIKTLIAAEFARHKRILNNDKLSDFRRKQVEAILNDSADYPTICNSLKLLSECLFEVTGQKTVVLIDEYDVPLQYSYFHGFYDQMVEFIRLLFSNVLKTNSSISFAVLTGCLRISKESIFTGLNNMAVFTVTDFDFSEYFGFTEQEVQRICEYYHLIDKLPQIKEWYDGYIFGNTEIYNPWSVLNYLLKSQKGRYSAKPYWSNTSSNSIIHEMISKGNRSIRDDMEKLITGLRIEKPLFENITYAEMNVNQESIWSFLLYTGYLKSLDVFERDDQVCFSAVIPNKEVRTIYKETIMQWFRSEVDSNSSKFLHAILNKEVNTLEYELNLLLMRSISYYDDYETFYHGLMTGLLTSDDRYEIVSNQEQGNGRSDIIITALSREIAVVIEIKSVKEKANLPAALKEAITQIDKQNYPATLAARGYPVILKYGIAFCKKQCLVKLDEAE